ncbi:MAG TPA: Hint domain-containing protein [Anaerolineales bacterium]|nr:Hint domain-containing protein [Anaerolineales bacterium]
MKKITGFTILLAVFLAACAPIIPESGSGGGGESTPIVITAEVGTVVASTVGPPGTEVPFPTPEPPTAIPTLPSATLSPTELKYKVLDQFPDFFFCDPDFYPIARDDEMPLAQQRFPELQANQEEFQAILNHNDLAGVTNFTDEQKLLIYREYKKLNAIYFQLVGDKYQFQIQTGAEGQQGSVITGTIDANGSIDIQKKEPGFPTCPICLAAGTLIDTPRGAVAVENLHLGDQVWTMNEAGQRVVGKILRTSRVSVPSTHQVVHIMLSDGRELWASAGHPTADGQALGNLKIGDLLDGARVILVERLPYAGTTTYDILPSGATGFYWANGILMGSTLSKR